MKGRWCSARVCVKWTHVDERVIARRDRAHTCHNGVMGMESKARATSNDTRYSCIPPMRKVGWISKAQRDVCTCMCVADVHHSTRICNSLNQQTTRGKSCQSKWTIQERPLMLMYRTRGEPRARQPATKRCDSSPRAITYRPHVVTTTAHVDLHGICT
jgi:hypothetical protein